MRSREREERGETGTFLLKKKGKNFQIKCVLSLSDPLSPSLFHRLDDLADHWIATCKTHGAVGTIRLLSYKEGVGKFGRLSVLDSHRGTGVAKALMQAMHEAVYDQAQYHTIICHAQLDKVAFYQSIGYQLLPGEAFYEGHVLHRKMMKTFKREKE